MLKYFNPKNCPNFVITSAQKHVEEKTRVVSLAHEDRLFEKPFFTTQYI